jgi:hypothetical protein
MILRRTLICVALAIVIIVGLEWVAPGMNRRGMEYIVAALMALLLIVLVGGLNLLEKKLRQDTDAARERE